MGAKKDFSAAKMTEREQKDFTFGMKAAPLHRKQLNDRFTKFYNLGLPPVIELHLFGGRDVYKQDTFKTCIKNCLDFEAEYYVHFPVQDLDTYGVYDPWICPGHYFETVLDFSQKINAKAVIMHRVYGIGTDISRKEARILFNEKIIEWARAAYPIRLYIENYSFIWLPKEFNQKFVLSQLDHFFPWEIAEFIQFISNERIDNVSVAVDLAHATISSNMFNLKKYNEKFKEDRRFDNILPEDLFKTDLLKPIDFLIDGASSYIHLSDALFIKDPKEAICQIDRYLTSESMPIGAGNLNFEENLSYIDDKAILIMEINSTDGDCLVSNHQYEGILHLVRLIRRSSEKR